MAVPAPNMCRAGVNMVLNRTYLCQLYMRRSQWLANSLISLALSCLYNSIFSLLYFLAHLESIALLKSRAFYIPELIESCKQSKRLKSLFKDHCSIHCSRLRPLWMLCLCYLILLDLFRQAFWIIWSSPSNFLPLLPSSHVADLGSQHLFASVFLWAVCPVLHQTLLLIWIN